MENLQELSLEDTSSLESTTKNWFKNEQALNETKSKKPSWALDFIEKKVPARAAIRKFYQLGYW